MRYEHENVHIVVCCIITIKGKTEEESKFRENILSKNEIVYTKYEKLKWGNSQYKLMQI